MLWSGGRRAQKRIGVRAWQLAVVIPQRRAEPEGTTGHRRFLDGNKLALYGESTFWPVRFAKFLRVSRHAPCAAESFSEVKDLAVPVVS